MVGPFGISKNISTKIALCIKFGIHNETDIILLPKYCYKEGFLSSQAKSSHPWLWKSIMRGKSVIEVELDVQIWGGEKTRTFAV